MTTLRRATALPAAGGSLLSSLRAAAIGAVVLGLAASAFAATGPAASGTVTAPPAIGAETPAVRVVRLEANAAAEPLGIDDAKPRLSWRLAAERRAVMQSAYQMLVATTPERLQPGKADLWDSGKVASADPWADYAGRSLVSRTRYYWSIRVWDERDTATAWSSPTWFETAFLDPDEWTAQWIGAAEGWKAPLGCEATPVRRACRRPAPVLRTEFAVEKPVRRARLYAASVGLGYYHLNGTQVAEDEVLSPARSSFDKRVRYVSHDVTALVREGTNALGVELGHGFDAGHEPVLRLELHVAYEDGSATVVRSGPGWRTTEGPTVFESAPHGENFDGARARELAGWTTAGHDDSAWAQAPVVAGRSGVMSAQAIEPIRVTETRKFTKITNPAPGVWVLHTDQNVAGGIRVTVEDAPPGTDIALAYAEKLKSDGTLDVIPEEGAPVQVLRSAQWDHFLPAGEGRETWAPRFSYKGFQYLQVQGWPDPAGPKLEDFKIQVMHTDFAPASTWASSNPLMNSLWRNTRWAIRQNWFSVPTDTPVNEKSGWTGDAQIMSAVTSYMFDTRRGYAKYYDDIADTQAANGDIPDSAPSEGSGSGGLPPATAWHNALFELPQVMELWFDDERLLRDWDAMRRYYEYFKRGWVGADHISTAPDWGDWADPGVGMNEDVAERLGGVPKRLHSTAFWYRWNRTMAEAARLRGDNAAAVTYDAEADATYKAFNDAFWNEVGGAYVDPDPLQTLDDAMYFNILALAFDLVPTDRRQRVVDTLVAQIHAKDDHLDVGIIGGKFLLMVLTENGHGELAYKIATQTTYPSWGYWVSQGATSLWETFEDDSRTHSHQMHGGFVQWYYEDLAGIEPLAPGFAQIEFAPQILEGLDWVKTAYDSVRGPVATCWEKTADGLAMDVTVPANATGVVRLPWSDTARVVDVASGVRVPADRANAVTFRGREGGQLVYEVGSGTYAFRAGDAADRALQHCQQIASKAQPDLTVSDLRASQAKPKETSLTATMVNTGASDAGNVVVEFRDGDTVLGRTEPVTVTAGAAHDVSFTWDTRGLKGEHRLTAVVDPDNVIVESNETNNSMSRIVTVRGNKVENGSFESSSDGTRPDGWSSSGSSASYDRSGEHASDGQAAAGVTGLGVLTGNPSWTSAPIDVTPGASYDLAMTVATKDSSSSPAMTVSYLDATGAVLGTVTGIRSTLTGDATARQVTGRIDVPAGVSKVRLTLRGSAPTDPAPRGTVWFDDIWMW